MIILFSYINVTNFYDDQVDDMIILEDKIYKSIKDK